MDHRRQLHPGEPVHVTVLVEQEAGSPATIAASWHDNIELLTDTPAVLGSAVKLESDGALFLGEVSSCRRLGDGFAIGVELRHALYNTRELAELSRRILEEDAPR